MSQPATHRLELLAPAGDADALAAALDAGADAVYFGLTTLNARRRARNLRPADLADAVARVHAHGARAYLTLNTDVTERELGQAARVLELARRSGVDAVLIRDAALLLLRPLFPELEFHFSTQACAASRADVEAARELGLNRVVLARELSLTEIAAAAAVPGVQTEVFVQGALCYCVSGRCLLSSWGGGRSGNRGLCTSPCRVPWRVGSSGPGQVLSMRDLSAVGRLADLARLGVAAVKIEGRMKTAAWVRDAVALYRQALDGAPAAAVMTAVDRLGAYTGRQMTSGYLDGQRHHLTGSAGRETAESAATSAEAVAEEAEVPSARRTFALAIMLGPRGIHCRCECEGHHREWDLPRTQVRRAGTEVLAARLLQDLAATELQGSELELDASAAEPDLALAPRTVRGIQDQLSVFLHQCRKAPAAEVRLDLQDDVRRCLQRTAPHAANTRPLGALPDRVRLSIGAAVQFAQHVPDITVVVEGATADDLRPLLAAVPPRRLVIALPPVLYDDDLEGARRLVQACTEAGVTMEANTWGGALLARRAGVPWETGLGLPVLNSLAARFLQAWGAAGVTLSIEADRQQLEDVCRSCPAPAALVVYGRPALMITRVEVPGPCLGQIFADRRDIRMVPRREGGLVVFRPHEPFSLMPCGNPGIRVAHLIADLVSAADPVAEWRGLARPQASAFAFNYGRRLT